MIDYSRKWPRVWLWLAGLAMATAGCGGVEVAPDDGAGGGGGGDAASTGASGTTAAAGAPTSTTTTAASGSPTSSASTSSGSGGSGSTSTGGPVNPCGTECGPAELCGGVHTGLDDDCDGDVDEGCPCAVGAATDCFIGDPSFRNAPGCFPGTMQCTESLTWGACEGGAHAWGDDPCQEGSLEGCHPITSVPFQIVDLRLGTGIFSQDADPGTEIWTVECPADVSPCPEPNGSTYQALQSGEYLVTYTKLVDGDEETCTYPLSVGARGLRVELTWSFASGTDLDLHMMQPNVATAFSPSGTSTDCTWDNCRIDNGFPEWFPSTAPQGDPVAWYLDPVDELNSCYFAPRGYGDMWRASGRGCHNPRLDLDNVSCTPSVTDPDNASFCAPENVNIDLPPSDQWVRLGVVHYSGNANQPTMKIFCDGALKAVLGPEGFNAPITLDSTDFEQNVWIAADVAFVADECSNECVIKPVYQDPDAQTPWIVPAPAGGPPFPSLPEPSDE